MARNLGAMYYTSDFATLYLEQ